MRKKLRNFAVIATAFAFIFVAQNHLWQNLAANLFSTESEKEAPTENKIDIFIPDNFVAQAGQIGEVSLRAASNFGNVVGFSFRVNWNSKILTAIGADFAGTKLENKGFLVQTDTETPGQMRVLAAQGGDGIDILRKNNDDENDEFFRLKFRVNSDAILGSLAELELSEVSIVQNANGKLIEAFPNSQNGAIKIQNHRSFRIKDAYSTKENNENPIVKVEFNENIKNDADEFYGKEAENKLRLFLRSTENKFAIQEEKKFGFDKNGKILDVKEIEQTKDSTYALIFDPVLEGEDSLLSPRHNFAIFTGYSGVDNDFEISEITSIDENTIEVHFSEAVKNDFFNASMFDIFGFNGEEFTNLEIKGVDGIDANGTVDNNLENSTTLKIATAKQESEALYFLVASPKIKN